MYNIYFFVKLFSLKHLDLCSSMKFTTHGWVLLLACNFTKSNTPLWVFAQNITSVIYKKLKPIFMRFFTSFIVQNYKRVFRSRSRVLPTQHFRAPITHSPLPRSFFAKITNINFILCRIRGHAELWRSTIILGRKKSIYHILI